MSNPTELPGLDHRTNGMTDSELIAYCQSHCETECALFNEDQVNRMIHLAGYPDWCVRKVAGWMSLHANMAKLCELALARRAQPEGEALQAVPAMWVQYIDGVKTQNVARDAKEKASVESIHRVMAPGTTMTWRALYDHAPAAQQAESGAQAEISNQDIERLADKHDLYANTNPSDYAVEIAFARDVLAVAAQSQGAQAMTADDLWEIYGALRAYGKVALSRKVADAASRAQQAAAPGALDADEMTRLRRLMRALGLLDEKQHTDEHVRGMLCTVLGWAAGQIEGKAAPSAPGTPEAPKKPVHKRLSEEEVREVAFQHLHDDSESAGRNGFFTFNAEGLDGFAIELMDRIRAAQLDGGQGEGK